MSEIKWPTKCVEVGSDKLILFDERSDSWSTPVHNSAKFGVVHNLLFWKIEQLGLKGVMDKRKGEWDWASVEAQQDFELIKLGDTIVKEAQKDD